MLIWKRMVVHVEKLEPSSNPLPLSHHHPARSSADLCGEKNSFPTSKGGRPKTWHRNCYNLCTMCMYIYIYICVYTAYNIIHNIICNMFKINNRYLYIYIHILVRMCIQYTTISQPDIVSKLYPTPRSASCHRDLKGESPSRTFWEPGSRVGNQVEETLRFSKPTLKRDGFQQQNP